MKQNHLKYRTLSPKTAPASALRRAPDTGVLSRDELRRIVAEIIG